jgi:hypothetical protein
MTPLGLLQTSSQAPTGLLVVVGVFALALVLLALRGLVDRLFGAEAATASYRLVEAGEGLALADDGAQDERLAGLDEAAMGRLIDRAEKRNEMRLHRVLDRQGGRHDWETWRADPDSHGPAAVTLEDSKGMVEIHASGRVEATPPLDDAVRGDLLEVLRGVLDEEFRGRD